MLSAKWWLVDATGWWGVFHDPTPAAPPQVTIEPLEPHRRKRRREDQSARLPPYNRPVVMAPQRVEIVIPQHPSQNCQAVLNAFAAILPIQGRLRLFGQLHDVVLVAALYRRQNLCFVLAYGMRLFLSSHFVSDGLHLFGTWRSLLHYPDNKKWQRQGVNEILQVQRNSTMVLLASLPRGVLRYRHTEQSRRDVLEFLRSSFVRDFALVQQIAGYRLATATELSCLENVPRVFPRTCLPQYCPCRRVPVYTPNVLDDLPSSIEHCVPVQRHFASFVKLLDPPL
jgi:hypothetical protein